MNDPIPESPNPDKNMAKSKPWIKLNSDIISDPKMGRLDDLTWRRAIEFFLIAGEYNQNGLLPPIGAIAWDLHTSEDDIHTALVILAEIGVTHQDETGEWTIVNFRKLHAPMSGAERMRLYRERKREIDDSLNAAGAIH
jgi:hypothetical protein